MPIPERFFAGGDYSMRGFGVDEVRPEGGNGLLLGSAEVRVDVSGGVSAAAFTDVGNVYRLASDITLSDLRYTAGIGLRYRSALGPLRAGLGLQARSPRGRERVALPRHHRPCLLERCALAAVPILLVATVAASWAETRIVERVLAVVDGRPVLLSEVRPASRVRGEETGPALESLIDEHPDVRGGVAAAPGGAHGGGGGSAR